MFEMTRLLMNPLYLSSNLGVKRSSTVLYRSHAFNYATPQFQTVLCNFKQLCYNIKFENPFVMTSLVTLMLVHSFGGPKVTPRLKVRQLRIFLLPFVFNSSSVRQLTLNQTNTLRVSILL